MAMRLNSSASLHWRQLDEDWIVFNENSGTTIFADPLTADCLMCLESNTYNFDLLVKQLAEDFRVDELIPFSNLVQECLDGLIKMNWIEIEH